MTDYATAKARVEAGDLRFEAFAALTIAHGEAGLIPINRAAIASGG